MKFSVYENRFSFFFLFFIYTEILFNKDAQIDVELTDADIMWLFLENNDLSLFFVCFFSSRRLSSLLTPPTPPPPHPLPQHATHV